MPLLAQKPKKPAPAMALRGLARRRRPRNNKISRWAAATPFVWTRGLEISDVCARSSAGRRGG